MGVIAFDPSCFADAVEEAIKDDADGIMYTEFPELTLLSPVSYYLMIQQSFSTSDTQSVHVVNQNRCLIATEDIDEWLENLSCIILSVVSGGSTSDVIIDESESFYNINNGVDNETIIKKILTDALETDILILTGNKKEILAGVLSI